MIDTLYVSTHVVPFKPPSPARLHRHIKGAKEKEGSRAFLIREKVVGKEHPAPPAVCGLCEVSCRYGGWCQGRGRVAWRQS